VTRRIEQLLEAPDRPEALFGIKLADQLHLLHSNAVLARDGAPHGNAVFENIFPGLPRPLQFARLAGIEENDRMQIPIPRVENVADTSWM
jgi:hypothetical protein